jgi:hypothetical protein
MISNVRIAKWRAFFFGLTRGRSRRHGVYWNFLYVLPEERGYNGNDSNGFRFFCPGRLEFRLVFCILQGYCLHGHRFLWERDIIRQAENHQCRQHYVMFTPASNNNHSWRKLAIISRTTGQDERLIHHYLNWRVKHRETKRKGDDSTLAVHPRTNK